MPCYRCDGYWICGPDPECESPSILPAGSAPCVDFTLFVVQHIEEGDYRAWCLPGQCVAVLAPSAPGPQWYDAGAVIPLPPGPLDAGNYEIWTKTGHSNACDVKIVPV